MPTGLHLSVARKWLLVLLSLGVFMLIAPATLNLGSAWRLRQWPVVPMVVSVPARGDAVEGARLAAVLGCRDCHGQDLSGRAECYEESGRFRLVCPNVTEMREHYDDRALVTLLRFGRMRTGALVDFMPWDMFYHLTDSDMGHVLAYVRSVPAVQKSLPSSTYSLSTRWSMLLGEYPVRNNLTEYDTNALGGPAERGRYLASIACTECHAPNLRGYAGDDAPSLVIAKAYSSAEFSRLMRDGITIAGTESRTGLMTASARKRFSKLHPDEVAAIKLYLDQLPP